MDVIVNSKEDFVNKKELLFKNYMKKANPLNFIVSYSILVEDFIKSLASNKSYNFALVSAGSFSRRELSPFSDIDLIFITNDLSKDEKDIASLVMALWDNGLEVSHTIRDYSDIQKYITTDLHTFTSLFETRFLLGAVDVYNEWNKLLFDSLTLDIQKTVIADLIEDTQTRYQKYGASPKVLEPNVKMSAGGLRDFQTIEWMYIIKDKVLFDKNSKTTQAELFIDELSKTNITTPNECARLLESYRTIVSVRNFLHLIHQQRYDRFEFNYQKRVASLTFHRKKTVEDFMKNYFKASNVINRFLKSMMKRYREEFISPLPDTLAFDLDEDFTIKGRTISFNHKKELTLLDILKGFYFRGLYAAHFDEASRSKIVERTESNSLLQTNFVEASSYFKEILKLSKNVSQTLAVMNELGVLGAFIPEFKDMIGFFQPGVYHCYTVDEHTLIAIENAEKLEKENTDHAKIFKALKRKDILYLAILFHDIAKPINVSGHEIIGAEMASSIMGRMGYTEREIETVMFLVRNHLVIEQVAFRRNLNDPETLNNFAAKFSAVEELDLLYLLTFADLSAVNPAVWTSWKGDLLLDLYRKTRSMLQQQITGEELLLSSIYVPSDTDEKMNGENIKEHLDSIGDIAYNYSFSEDEIITHVEEISKGELISVIFKELSHFTNVTVITKNSSALLSKICGVFAINDVNINDARIFTRKDGIIIDTFNVTEFKTHQKINETKYDKIRNDLNNVLLGLFPLNVELADMRSRWKRLESVFFKRSGKVKVVFDKHEKYTILEIHSPDRLGLLYHITNKMNELGLEIYLAKISTKGDDIVDTFYVLNRFKKKISPNDYEFIRTELQDTITQII